MYDRDDVDEAERNPGKFPNIDLLRRIYNEVSFDSKFLQNTAVSGGKLLSESLLW